MSYQTFGKNKGSSDSKSKFLKLQLTPDLIRDKTILDFGCNEGYFCFELQKLGAKNIIGIDKTESTIKLANKRNIYDNVKFIHGDINLLKTLSDKSFDIIIILSALHYMSNPEERDDKDIPRIFYEIHRLLTDNGIFVFEGGVDKSSLKNEFIKLHRSKDIVFHPTETKLKYIFNTIFSKYINIGDSINQKGDKIPRYVYRGYK